MEKFKKPIEGIKIQYETTEYEKSFYDPNPGLNVVCPFDGKVVEAVKLTCNGKFRIEHEVNNGKFYSNFCNLSGPKIYFPGNDVTEGKKIGETGNDKLEYWITNERDKKQNIKEFFTTVVSNKTKKEDSKTKEEKEKEKKKKEEEEKKNKQTNKKKESDNLKSSSKSYDSDGVNVSNIVTKDSRLPFTDLFLSPFGLVSKIVKEDIERMKKLMK